MVYIWLLAGFVLLIKGADFFVDGASGMARRFHVAPVIIGLTIVALGTSLPEASVSISASLSGSNALAISNVIGSNLFNTLVVVGASALIAPFLIDRQVVSRDLSVNVGSSLLLVLCIVTGMISRWMGLLFLVLLAIYLFVLIRQARQESEETAAQEEDMSWLRIGILLVLGCAAIIFGGTITVDSARAIARDLGMSENLIGLTVVAIGTSLPELVTSVTAARKGESGLSIGNAIGSNILNILFILGASSVIHPLECDLFNLIDSILLLIVAVLMLVMCRFSARMTRIKGILMIALYICFMIYTIVR